MSCLSILDINPLSVLLSASIFSHFCHVSFCFLMVSFVVEKFFLHLIRSHLFIFAFLSFALVKRSMKILLLFKSENVLPKFFSGSLMVSCFRCLNHFEFTFVYAVRECSNCIDLHVAALLTTFIFLIYLKFFKNLIYFLYLSVPGLSWGMWDPVPQPGIQLRPCIGRVESAPGPLGKSQLLTPFKTFISEDLEAEGRWMRWVGRTLTV